MLGRNKLISSLLTLLAFADNVHTAELLDRIQKDVTHLLGPQTNPAIIAQACLIISPACQNEITYTQDFMHAFLNFMINQSIQAFQQLSPEIDALEYAKIMWQRKFEALQDAVFQKNNVALNPLHIPASYFEEGCFAPYLTEAFIQALQSEEIPPAPIRSKFLNEFSWKEEFIKYLDAIERSVDAAQYMLGKTKWALALIRASLGLPPAPYYMR